MSRALLQQALDALQESLSKLSPFAYENELRTGEYGIIRAIEALKEELAKPEQQKPIAIIGSIDMINLTAKVNFIPAANGLPPNNFDVGLPLYTSPQPNPLTPSDFWNAAPWQPMETAPVLINMNVFRNHIKPILGERMDKPVVLRYINNAVP